MRTALGIIVAPSMKHSFSFSTWLGHAIEGPPLELDAVASVMGRTIPVYGSDIGPLYLEMQMVESIWNRGSMKDNGPPLTKINAPLVLIQE